MSGETVALPYGLLQSVRGPLSNQALAANLGLQLAKLGSQISQGVVGCVVDGYEVSFSFPRMCAACPSESGTLSAHLYHPDRSGPDMPHACPMAASCL
jgi:hypothetical protein